MVEFQIRLSSVQQVQAFVGLATTYPFPVKVRDGSYQVNGKSFMEMFCLKFDRPLTVAVTCSQEDAQTFQAAVNRLLNP